MEEKTVIRKAVMEDLEAIMPVYAAGKSFMDRTGNPTQWTNGYPRREMVIHDIECGNCVVCLENGEIHGVFAYFTDPDPTYAVIEDGAWPNDLPYGTIHRIANDGKMKGLLSKAVAWCSAQTPVLRADTHHDNKVMQHCLEKNGFQRCGIIYLEDGDPRIAYQREA